MRGALKTIPCTDSSCDGVMLLKESSSGQGNKVYVCDLCGKVEHINLDEMNFINAGKDINSIVRKILKEESKEFK